MAKIAVVEDNENIKNELIEFLSAYGYEAFGICLLYTSRCV